MREMVMEVQAGQSAVSTFPDDVFREDLRSTNTVVLRWPEDE
ncbi:MAG: hypothetical protein ACPGD3_00705 [Luminiphilus sp.]